MPRGKTAISAGLANLRGTPVPPSRAPAPEARDYTHTYTHAYAHMDTYLSTSPFNLKKIIV